jgi:hypothetical protein
MMSLVQGAIESLGLTVSLPVRLVSGRRGDGLTETETVAARRANALTKVMRTLVPVIYFR